MISKSADNRHIVVVCIVVLFEFISFGVAVPILPRLIGHLNTTSIPAAAYVFAISLVGDTITFFWAPAMGTLSDRLGRRRILIVSVIAVAASSIARFLADHIYIFFLVSAVNGFAAATLSTAMSSVADVVGRERRATVFGWLTGTAVSGYIIGPIIGGFTSDIDVRLPFLIAAIIGVLNMLFVLTFLKETLPPEKREKRAIGLKTLSVLAIRRQPPKIKVLLTLFFLAYFVMWFPNSFVVIYLIQRFGWSGSMIGTGLSVHMAVAAFGQLVLAGWLSRRWGALNVSLASACVAAIFLIILGLANVGFVILMAYALFGIISLAIPTCSSLISIATPPESQGEIQGVLASLVGLSRIAAYGVFGPAFAFVVEKSGSPFVSGLPFVFIGLTLLAILALVRRRMSQLAGS